MSLPDTVFIFVLALIIFGPKKLPEMARQLGRLVGEFRRASNDFKFQIEEELRQAERNDQTATRTIGQPAIEASTGPSTGPDFPSETPGGDNIGDVENHHDYTQPSMPASLATLTAAAGSQPRTSPTESIEPPDVLEAESGQPEVPSWEQRNQQTQTAVVKSAEIEEPIQTDRALPTETTVPREAMEGTVRETTQLVRSNHIPHDEPMASTDSDRQNADNFVSTEAEVTRG